MPQPQLTRYRVVDKPDDPNGDVYTNYHDAYRTAKSSGRVMVVDYYDFTTTDTESDFRSSSPEAREHFRTLDRASHGKLRLIEECLRRNIRAEPVALKGQLRDGWDGYTRDVYLDFVCLWRRLEEEDESLAYGTHTGTIRIVKDPGKADRESADIFWGHYDLSLESARASFDKKAP